MKKHFDVLLPFSGGQDSTYVLYKQLKNNPHERVFVHHVQLRHNAEDRLHQEIKACENVMNYLRSNGLDNFYYTGNHAFDYGDLPRIPIKDLQIIAYFSAIILKTPNYTGFKKLLFPWHAGEVDENENQRGFRVRAIFQALSVPEIKFSFPIANMTREQMAADMPPELLAMCWTCRKPQPGNHACGQCKTCLELIQAKIPLR